MGQLVVDMFVTLDGVMQAPGEPDEDRDGGFEHGGWQAPYFDEESGKRIGDHIARMDALLLGRKTYEIFAAYWPNAPDPIGAKLNRVPKYVASRTLGAVEWNNSTLIEGDVADAVPRLKQDHGEVHVIGSGNLVKTLLQHGLIDVLNLWLYPILLGTGKRLFADGTIPTALRLTDSATFAGGAVLLTYERAGKPTYGNLARDADDRPVTAPPTPSP
ncbi:MAG TPA: dihydrofolate reductase family protein [Acidimicrobiales bacterium]|jgi:dihydrofolate reductase|nr:dihydrofolate reductase family protein [Acidimicrobiales bacterium]